MEERKINDASLVARNMIDNDEDVAIMGWQKDG